MPHHELIMLLAAGLCVALVFGYITHRLGLSPIVGYLLAGIAVGPHTPGFIGNEGIAEEFAELGVILMMFGVGLQFHLKELLAVRNVAIPGAIVQSTVATVLGAVLCRFLGWDWSSGVVFGMSLAVASTVVLLRVLADNRDLHTQRGHIAVGWLVVEDLFTVLILVLLPVLFGANSSASEIPLTLFWVTVKVVGMVVFIFVIGGRVIPWFLNRIAATRSRELFTLSVLALALGIAAASIQFFQVSMALGAFLAGMVVGRSDFSYRAASEALPMRDAFAVLFFVAVGMLFDWRAVGDNIPLLLITLFIVMVGKPLAALAITTILRYPLKTGIAVALVLAQIGEFSFILAKEARNLGLLDNQAFNTMVTVAIVSISLNPLLYRAVGPIEKFLSPFLPSWMNGPATDLSHPNEHLTDEEADPEHRAIVIGYGPVGRTVTRLLSENGVQPTIIDLNMQTVQELRAQGIHAIYGDATNPDILQGAGAETAMTLILSSSTIQGGAEIIRLAKKKNPRIRVLARSIYLSELNKMRAAGADVVYSGEGEIALALTTAVLEELGATPEQIDRERERVHSDLFEQSNQESAKH